MDLYRMGGRVLNLSGPGFEEKWRAVVNTEIKTGI